MYAISVSVFQPPVCVALALTLLQSVMKSVKRRPGGRPWLPSMRYSSRLSAVMPIRVRLGVLELGEFGVPDRSNFFGLLAVGGSELFGLFKFFGGLGEVGLGRLVVVPIMGLRFDGVHEQSRLRARGPALLTVTPQGDAEASEQRSTVGVLAVTHRCGVDEPAPGGPPRAIGCYASAQSVLAAPARRASLRRRLRRLAGNVRRSEARRCVQRLMG